MEPRLTPSQVSQLVGEVERLSQRQQDELSPEQVKDILRELNLPPELLDEAMIQLRRREALAVEQRRNRSILLAGLAVTVIAIAGIAPFFQHGRQAQQALAQVSASGDRLTLREDTSNDLTSVARQNTPNLAYYVTLKNAPVGKKLSLSCNWIDPTGQVVRQNHYDTKEITTATWNTHCRYQLGSDAAPGTWTVQLFLDGRLLSDDSFAVK